MSYIKADNLEEQEMFDYLEELRRAGDTNMLDASYLQRVFVISKKEAITVLSKWMRLHSGKTRKIGMR
jgi:hypothetical protein